MSPSETKSITGQSLSYPELKRIRVLIRGAVQGVGFRPFVFRLAKELGLCGWVSNDAAGVTIEVEADSKSLDKFLSLLESLPPPRSHISSLEFSYLAAVGYDEFRIRESDGAGARSALVMADIATCPDCLQEIFDPANRRYHYPFTNCTNCGPRYTIITALPYDRDNTSMRQFVMCPECRQEYENPEDRRFHAQPNACPVCGPKLQLLDSAARTITGTGEPLIAAAELIKNGEILAIKGLGGFHLIVDAANNEAVARLRRRKGREEKPFALMLPSLDSARLLCQISDDEARLISSPEAPIVLLRRKHSDRFPLSELVAPDNRQLGLLLPYTPLHHLLMRALGRPVVATSGNISDESICISNQEAFARLSGIADYFLVHNRDIVRPVDDSVVRHIAGREMIIRRARGYAPLPVYLKDSLGSRLAVGAHLKNSIAVSSGKQVFISQHIGDLESALTAVTFENTIRDISGIYDVTPDETICDLHPDYLSSKYAARTTSNLRHVQHHHAHIFSCMAENEITPPLLGVVWDGTGLGFDNQIWGGEFFVVGMNTIRRAAHFRPFRLPGGDKAIKEPRRSAFSLLYQTFGENTAQFYHLPCFKSFRAEELRVLADLCRSGLNSPWTTSAGRVFDAVSSLLDLSHFNNFEGQAALKLEQSIDLSSEITPYKIDIVQQEDRFILDWEPMIRSIMKDLAQRRETGTIAAAFHNALIDAIVALCRTLNISRVALSGGCFQNSYLLERTISSLRQARFEPFWHRHVPTNDGGIALGQIFAAAGNYKWEP